MKEVSSRQLVSMKAVGIIIAVVIMIVAGYLAWRESNQNDAVPPQEKTMQEIDLKSSAFPHSGLIPERYTCDGQDINPPIEMSGVPEGAKTLALIMHDPDAPRVGGWTHWVRYNISWNMEYGTWNIREGEEPKGTAGKGTGGNLSYEGPCPPSGTHRYIFTVYALDAKLALKEGATKAEVEKAMSGHILAAGELIGLYSRTQ